MIADRARFGSALASIAGGGAVAAGAFTLPAPTERWLAMGVGAGVLVLVAAGFATRGRGSAQRVLDLALTLACAWTIVCSRVIESTGAGSSPHAVKWWGIAAGAALCGAGLLSLVLHEWRLERHLRQTEEQLYESRRRELVLHDGDRSHPIQRHQDALSRTAG